MDPWDVLKEYRVTEKASVLSANVNCYTFEVAKESNRTMVATAVEAIFGVKVKKVCLLNRRPKVKRSRSRKFLPGSAGGMKKAMVILEKGCAIKLD